jgi:hypothetical protein
MATEAFVIEMSRFSFYPQKENCVEFQSFEKWGNFEK